MKLPITITQIAHQPKILPLIGSLRAVILRLSN
jgi:hypothetical protein